jgi:voltage-gated potassium channel
VGLIVLVLASSLLYNLEHDAQPEVFTHIPATIWWAIVTLTTVGYGDVVPITVLGKAVGGVVMVLGVGLVALPAGILASAFSEAGNDQRCRHCGEIL